MKPTAALVALALCVLPRLARGGEEKAASLSWVRLPGAEACVGARALAQSVEARLGRAALVSAARGDLTIEGHVAPASRGGGWRAVIAVADEAGARLGIREITTSSPRCDALDDDLALAIALMIDPDAKPAPVAPAAPSAPSTSSTPSSPGEPVEPGGASASGEAPAPSGGASTAGAPSPPDRPSAPPEAPQVVVQRILIPPSQPSLPRPASLRADVSAGPAFVLGLLPAFGVAATLRAHIAPRRLWAFEIGGLVWAPNETEGGVPAARFSWAEGFISVCPLEIGVATRLSGCAGVRAGAMSATGSGFHVNLGDERFTLSGTLEARVRRRLLGPLTAAIGAGLVAPFVRDTFYYIDVEGRDHEIFRPAPIGATADFLLGVELPQ